MDVSQTCLRGVEGRRGRLPLGLVVFLMGAAWLAASARYASAQGQTEVVAVTGDQVANSEEAFVPAFVARFSTPVINNHGEVAFVGHSQAGGIGRGGGPVVSRVYRGRRGRLTRIYEGSVSTNIDLNDAGQVALLTANTTSPVVIRGDGTTTVEIARAGQPLPVGTLSSLIGAPNITNDGGVSFVAGGGRRGPGGVYRGAGSALEVIAQNNQTVPEDGGTFSNFNPGGINLPAPSTNESGQVAFWAGAITGGEAYDGIFLGDGISTARIARDSQTPPFGPNEFRNVDWQQPLVNDAGRVAFFTDDVNDFPPGGDVYLSDGATLTRIGGSATSVLGLNNAGQVLFAGLAEGNRPGLLLGTESSLVSIAVQAGTDGANWLEGASLNEAGQVAFLSNTCGLCLYDESLGIVEVAQISDPFLESTIVDLGFRGSIGGEPGSLTDTGIPRIAYSFALADGRQGIAVWSLVPEPGSFVLVGLAMVGFGIIWHRRRKI